ncbi:uncharacterized protein LOC125754371 [Canis lupus dingo]|uniref:formin-like protein 5 n=1 Tax=Canis lupus familiaris TaxID=9615 RepID=UPI000DC6700A|nr:formin-like protein 5 [Canis lupus familiaris]XP_048961883.1 uncharacterized protein LOC125754371 [Canis lupus dingo]
MDVVPGAPVSGHGRGLERRVEPPSRGLTDLLRVVPQPRGAPPLPPPPPCLCGCRPPAGLHHLPWALPPAPGTAGLTGPGLDLHTPLRAAALPRALHLAFLPPEPLPPPDSVVSTLQAASPRHPAGPQPASVAGSVLVPRAVPKRPPEAAAPRPAAQSCGSNTSRRGFCVPVPGGRRGADPKGSAAPTHRPGRRGATSAPAPPDAVASAPGHLAPTPSRASPQPRPPLPAASTGHFPRPPRPLHRAVGRLLVAPLGPGLPATCLYLLLRLPGSLPSGRFLPRNRGARGSVTSSLRNSLVPLDGFPRPCDQEGPRQMLLGQPGFSGFDNQRANDCVTTKSPAGLGSGVSGTCWRCTGTDPTTPHAPTLRSRTTFENNGASSQDSQPEGQRTGGGSSGPAANGGLSQACLVATGCSSFQKMLQLRSRWLGEQSAASSAPRQEPRRQRRQRCLGVRDLVTFYQWIKMTNFP